MKCLLMFLVGAVFCFVVITLWFAWHLNRNDHSGW